MPQGSVLVDEASESGIDRPLDGPGIGDGAGPLEEFVIDVDESLGHWSQYISATGGGIPRWLDLSKSK
jgi:hypothetical protein